jgi:hypothetical protein
LDDLERIRALIEEYWQEGPGKDAALRAVNELISEAAEGEDADQKGE